MTPGHDEEPLADDVALLTRLDAAVLALRRITDAPPGRPVLRHAAGQVEISTMLVVDAVARSEHRGDRASIGTVADALRVSHSTASRLVTRAVDAGMVDRRRHPDDPRRARLALTGAGRRLQAEAVRFRTGRLAAVLAGWPRADVEALARLLERFARDAFPPDHGEAP